jgi:hypothetical protein
MYNKRSGGKRNLKGILRQFILLPVLLIIAFNLLQLDMPIDKSVAAAQVMVRIVGPDSVLLESYAVDMEVLASLQQTGDLTPEDNDKNPNALDAVLYATLQNSFESDSYAISYNDDYGAYYIHKLAGISADHPDYWGTLIASSAGNYDSGALCSHPLTAGDTYTVYYDKHTGSGANYGNQSYASFQEASVHGGTGETITVGLITVGYDENWNTVASPLAGATIYATGPGAGENTAVAVTDQDGKAYIKFAAAGTYLLTVSSDDYTYTRCTAAIAGSNVTLYEVRINVTDRANQPVNASFTLTDQANRPCSAYAISAGTYFYRLTEGTYQYSASAPGYIAGSDTLDISKNESFDICLVVKDTYTVTIAPGGGEAESIMVRNSSGMQQTPVSAADGVVQYELADGNYSYTVSRIGFHSTFGSFAVDGTAVDIHVPALSDTAAASAEWPAWRNASNNMAVTSSPTARGAWQAEEKWAASLGELGSWGTLSTSNMILYDGYLYIATEHGLSKLDSSSGRLLAATPLSGDASYVSQIAFGDGKVFATTAAGLDAFDALTMERLWSCRDFDTFGSAYMCATPLFYDNGMVYVGNYGCSTYNSLGTYGGYSAIDANNGQIRWNFWGGKDTVSYGAGAVKQDNYLVFGSEDGFLRAIDLHAAETNESRSLLAEPLKLAVGGAIRSTIASDGGYLYFTTSHGYIYKVALDGELRIDNSAQFAPASTSTPLIYNGRIYVGASDGIYVLNAGDLTTVSHFTTSAPVLSSVLLSSADSGIAYAYFTVNSARGEIVVLTDDGIEVKYSLLYEPSQRQYCLNSLIADDGGVIYYSNDSGYVFAVSNNLQPREGLTAATINVTPAVIHQGSSTIYPEISVKNSSGTKVATTVPGTYYLAAGDYSYTISLSGYQTATGTFTVTTADIAASSKAIPAVLAVPADNPTTSMLTVTFNLQDVDHAFRKSVTVGSGSTVKDVFVKAMNSAGVDYTIRSGGYVETIDGLSEGDKGANSGWMFKVNGSHPGVGINDYYVASGDEIVFHFSGDYTGEEDEQEWQAGEKARTIEEISGSAPPAAAFADVDNDAWYNEAVSFVIARGLFSGTGPKTFEPDRTMTRAMFVTVLARLSGADLSAFKDAAFSDVAGDAWYATAVAWAADNGLVDGLGEGRFGPDEEITREQMCTLLMRYAQKSGIQLTEAGNAMLFDDEEAISGLSLENVRLARQAGIIQGKAGNCFDPQGVLTRAEAATIFMRFVQNTVQ